MKKGFMDSQLLAVMTEILLGRRLELDDHTNFYDVLNELKLVRDIKLREIELDLKETQDGR